MSHHLMFHHKHLNTKDHVKIIVVTPKVSHYSLHSLVNAITKNHLRDKKLITIVWAKIW
jgi:hypothetical protein